MLNRSKHSLTVKPDIRGYRYANVRKATCSRLTNVNTRMSATAEFLSLSDRNERPLDI